MSSNLESTAVFRARLEEKGIEMLLPRFKDKLNVTTLGELAFCTSFVPGVTPDAVFRAEVVEKVLDTTNENEAKLVGYVRRLFFDAYVACTYETKQRLERKADEAPRKLDDVERRERRKAFLADHPERGERFWDNERKASDDLIDAYVHMWETKDVAFVPWAERTTQKYMRDHGPRKEKRKVMAEFITDDQGRLVWQAPDQPVTEPLVQGTADFALKWDRMMERNGMATEIAGILSFKAHERIRYFLEEARTEELADARFEPVSWDQVLKAEEEIWRQLGERLQEKVRGRPGGNPPADDLIETILTSRRVSHILQNAMRIQVSSGVKRNLDGTPRTQQKGDGKGAGEGAGKKKKHRGARRKATQEAAAQRRQEEQAAAASAQAGGRGGGRGRGRKGDGRGRGRGAAAKSEPRRPSQLIGHEVQNAQGENLCWHFNLDTCTSGKKPGERCSKGWHLCARKGCGFQPHAFKDCPNK